MGKLKSSIFIPKLIGYTLFVLGIHYALLAVFLAHQLIDEFRSGQTNIVVAPFILLTLFAGVYIYAFTIVKKSKIEGHIYSTLTGTMRVFAIIFAVIVGLGLTFLLVNLLMGFAWVIGAFMFLGGVILTFGILLADPAYTFESFVDYPKAFFTWQYYTFKDWGVTSPQIIRFVFFSLFLIPTTLAVLIIIFQKKLNPPAS
jgi:hypothetical protein